ncbi:hypothetical protein OHQ88_13815 [Micromonospora zamorensis]|nr:MULTISPECIES: hypothetical protein [Micromonospora]WSR53915.1 hypothetical protein OG400_19100 [Micromonospora ureilytica]
MPDLEFRQPIGMIYVGFQPATELLMSVPIDANPHGVLATTSAVRR